MVKRRLGKTEFEVTTIGLGTWAIGGRQWGPQDDETSIGAIHAAIDHGVNWVDTAPIYGSGHSEEVVGRAVKRLPASGRPLVFTKFGLGVNVDAPVQVRRRARGRRGVRGEPAPTWRGSDRSLPAALAGAAADRRDRRRVREAAGGGQDSRDRRLELLGRSAGGMDGDRCAAALRPAAVQHSAAGRGRGRPAVVRRARRRRDLVLATLPRHVVRHVVARQDLRRGRCARRPQGLLGPAISAAPRRGRRASGDRAAVAV